MKWSNVIVVLGLIVLAGFLGNGLISCTTEIRQPCVVTSETIIEIDEERGVFGLAYMSITETADVTLEYRDGSWWALDYGGGDFAVYQKLDSYLNKRYSYQITNRTIDNK